jgi:hypothetical protein
MVLESGAETNLTSPAKVGRDLFIFATAVRLETIRSSIQWVPVDPYSEVKYQVLVGDQSPTCSVEVRNV